MANNRINPRSGKRYSWEEEQKALHAHELERKELEKSIQLLERQQAIMSARESLMSFTKFTRPHPEDPNDVKRTSYKMAPFHKAVAEALEEVVKGNITKLIFCMPPRHGKSELATRRLAAWYAGLHPEHDIIIASASDKLAEDFGQDIREIMGTPQFKQVFPSFGLVKGGTAKDNIRTRAGGRIVSAGRGGTINGRGANLLLVDDLFRDFEDARSQAMRDMCWNWLLNVAFFRRMGKKLTIITMTRWHSDDIIGRLTDPDNPHFNLEESKTWKIIRIPAIAEEGDPPESMIGRKPGEALWESEYSAEYLLGMARINPLGFAALQQQRPTVADGILFRRENIQYYDPRNLDGADLRYYAASDHAVGTKQTNDPSCFIKVAVDRQDNIYILETVWDRIPTDRAVEAMLTMGSGDRKPIIWWAERGHISKSIGPFLYKRMQETGTYLNIVEVTPAADKEQRAQSIAARVAMGKVYFPKGQPWAEKAIEQMLAFPNGTFDDFVDSLAYIGLGLQSLFGKGAKAPLKKQSTHGTFNWLKDNDKWVEAKRRSASLGGF